MMTMIISMMIINNDDYDDNGQSRGKWPPLEKTNNGDNDNINDDNQQ